MPDIPLRLISSRNQAILSTTIAIRSGSNSTGINRLPYYILTVVANENFEACAERLQNEIGTETGIRFGIIEKDAFTHLIIPNTPVAVDITGSDEIWL